MATGPPTSPSIATIPAADVSSGGMYRAHGLERHVTTYTLTESDMDLLGSGSFALNACTAAASFFASMAATGFLGGATLSSGHWTTQQWALFYYIPVLCIALAVIFALLACFFGIQRHTARERIRRESFTPGTYVPGGPAGVASS